MLNPKQIAMLKKLYTGPDARITVIYKSGKDGRFRVSLRGHYPAVSGNFSYTVRFTRLLKIVSTRDEVQAVYNAVATALGDIQ